MYIKIILDTRSRNNAGKHPVKLRFTSGTRSAYIAMSMFALPEEWDEDTYFSLKNKDIRDKHKRNNAILLKELERAEELLHDLTKKGIHNIPPTQFKELFLSEEKQVSGFLQYFAAYRDKQLGRTNDVYSYTLSKLQKYVTGTLFFEDINKAWLEGFEKYLQEKGNAVNTIAIDFRNIRAVYNDAIDNDAVGLQYYPFRKFKIKKEETEHRAISADELRKIFAFEGTESENWARDVAKLMFLLIGINAADLFSLDSIINDRIGYRRCKTKRLYSIRLEPEMIPLLEQFKGNEHLLVFEEQFSIVANFLKKLNGQTITKNNEKVVTKHGLNTIGEKLGIPGLTSYVMRHTWATLAAELDIPKETISAALGHGKKTVTDIYIQFDRKKIDEANRKVISHVFYNRTELLKEAKLKYNAYDPEDWTKAYFDKISGGFNVYHKDHNFSKKGGGGKAEKIVGKMLARHNAKQVEFLPESGYQKSPDINFDTQTWDIKYIDNANIKTIRSYIEIIRRKECQGIFYWEKEEKIQDLKSAMESEIGKLSKLGRMSEMPDIYYMNKNKILTLLWGKK